MATGCVALRGGPAVDTCMNGQPFRSTPHNSPSHLVATTMVSPNFTSSDLFTPFGPPRSTLPGIATFARPSYGKSNYWGAVTTSYGGVGPAVNDMKESVSTSRSHRHYGTGCTNFYAPQQPYSITGLVLSQCRPWDQLLPNPLVTSGIENRQLQEKYPKNGAFTSHESKFGVFPTATTDYSPTSVDTQGLSSRTVNALRQLHRDLYSTSTYSEHFSVHTSQQTHRLSGANGAQPLEQTTPPTIEAAYGVNVKDTGDTIDDVNKEEYLENEVHTEKDACNGAVAADKAYDGDDSSEVVSIEATDREETHQVTQEESDAQETLCEKERDTNGDETDFTEGDRESPSLLLNHSRLGHTRLPQLPEHFCCVTCKCTQNRSSTPCSSFVPYYLLRRHSYLPSSFTLPDHPFSREKPFAVDLKEGVCQRRSCQEFIEDPNGSLAAASGKAQAKTPVQANSSSIGLIPKIAENVKGRLVSVHGLEVAQSSTEGKLEGECKLPQLHGDGETRNREAEGTTRHGAQRLRAVEGRTTMSASGTDDELPQDIPLLSSLLTPSGSRVPHRLGLRYKTEAHRRYHTLYPDQVPDLRDASMAGKKYFFYGYHASAFRG